MATRSVDSGIPRTYRDSFRLGSHGFDAIVRAKIGLFYAVGHSVAAGASKGIRSARAGAAAAKARRAEIVAARAAAGDAVVTAGKHSNTSVIVGAVAGLAMVGAGLALLKYNSTQKPDAVELDVESFDDDAQLDEAAV